ncbi:hypothetical protein T439DRAFT_72158 [Meredithblackwellia eburnea MCA 4105]
MTNANQASDPSQSSAQYSLPRNSVESKRLESQHRRLLAGFDGKLLHPSITIPSSGSKVLESGTGTSIWLRDVGAQLSNPSQLAGADLSALQFPPEEDRVVHAKDNGRNLKVDLREWNVCDELPKEWEGNFDLVHQRFLVWGLSKDEWPGAVKHLAQALKPGGWLQLAEVVPELIGMDGDIQTTANQIMVLGAKLRNKDHNCLDHLEGWMTDAGLTKTELWQIRLPCGHTNNNVADRVASQNWFLDIFHQVWSVSHMLIPDQLPEGVRTEKEKEEFVRVITAELEEKGCWARTGIAVGQKPASA